MSAGLTRQLAFDLSEPNEPEPFGDPEMNRAFVQSMQANAAHRVACSRGCQLEPPVRCTRGYGLRQAEHDAHAALIATVEPAIMAGIHARVDAWVQGQRTRDPLWWTQ